MLYTHVILSASLNGADPKVSKETVKTKFLYKWTTKKHGCLGYIGDYTSHSYGDCNKPF